VWYRFNKILLKFYLSNGQPAVDLINLVSLDILLSYTEGYSQKPLVKRPVLFLELKEDEVNPCSDIATLLQPSNRDVFSLTKDFEKSEAIYMLINPPACEDLCTIACLQAQFGSNSMFRGMSNDSIIELITNRVNTLGPIPRYVLSDDKDFESQLKLVNKNVINIFGGSKLDHLSESNVPQHAKDYVAPFVNDETAVPYLLGGDPVSTSLRILSPHLARLIATACTHAAKKIFLQRYDFVYRIEEEIVRYGLMNHSSLTQAHDDAWLAENWKYFKSGKDGAIIKLSDKIQYFDIGITPCSDSIHFDSMYLNQSVVELKNLTLYISKKHNGALYDCMYVNHNVKTVFAFQCSSQKPEAHKLNITTVNNVMTKLKLLDNNYTMRYIYCYSSAGRSQKSCILQLGNKSDDMTKAVSKALEIYIARIKYFPCDKTVLPK
jgi:hypothetical protein